MQPKSSLQSNSNHYIDEESVSSDSSQNCKANIKPKIPIKKIDYWQLLNQSECFNITNNFKNWYDDIANFVEMDRSVLFLFGPSGCGKRKLMNKFLSINEIPYEIIQQKQIENDQFTKYLPLSECILQCLSQRHSPNTIRICYSFPLLNESNYFPSILQFKQKLLELIKKSSIKLIFILNSQIYNSFYILNENSSNDKNYNMCKKVSVVKMTRFLKRDMKITLQKIIEYQKIYDLYYLINTNGKNKGKNTQNLDQIFQLSEGDLRKALNLLYLKLIQRQTLVRLKQERKNNPYPSDRKKYFVQSNQLQTQYNSQQSQYYGQNKTKKPDLQKLNIYHGLGKLLYGKRLDIKNAKLANAQKSCYYSQAQLKHLDPPFYFDPPQLYRNLHIQLPLFISLLQQNYINRFGTLKDISSINGIFCILDSLFSMKNQWDDEEVKRIRVELLTWGMLIYNRNSKVGERKGLEQIEKFQGTNLDKRIKEKTKLLKIYFNKRDLSSTIQFAHMIRKKLPSDLLSRTLFNEQKLSKRQVVNSNIQTLNQSQQEQQQQFNHEGLNSNIQKQLIAMKLKISEKAKSLENLFQTMDEQYTSD